MTLCVFGSPMHDAKCTMTCKHEPTHLKCKQVSQHFNSPLLSLYLCIYLRGHSENMNNNAIGFLESQGQP